MRKQRAFTGLKEEEIEQIADWLRHSTYDQVRERLAKPRPEGFGLELKSTRPLETLYAKSNRVDRINHKIQTGQKLTLADFDAINAGERAELPEQIHDAILETTYQIVMEEDNTPTQLLALQRLADFPARADYRQHKIQMDLHRKEMAEHRKHNSEERLALAKRSQELRDRLATVREQELALKKAASPNRNLNPNLSPECDELGPIATTVEELQARTRRAFGHKPPPVGTTSTSSQNSTPQSAFRQGAPQHAVASAPSAISNPVNPISVNQPTTNNEQPYEANIIQNRMPGPA